MRLALPLGLALLFACGGETHFAPATGTSTIAVGQVRAVVFDQPLLLTVEGDPLGRDIVVSFEATITASTTERANAAAAALAIRSGVEDGVLVVRLSTVAAASKIAGNMHAVVPDRLELGAKAPGGVLVRGMVANIDLRTDVGAEIYDAKGSVRVSTSGGVILDSNLLQSTVADVTAQGDIRVSMPAGPSAAITAQAGGMGKIVVRHPVLPASTGQQRYTASVNGGLAELKLVSLGGSVTLESRP